MLAYYFVLLMFAASIVGEVFPYELGAGFLLVVTGDPDESLSELR